MIGLISPIFTGNVIKLTNDLWRYVFAATWITLPSSSYITVELQHANFARLQATFDSQNTSLTATQSCALPLRNEIGAKEEFDIKWQ